MYINIWLDFGFFKVRTTLMKQSDDLMIKEYIVLKVELFGKGFAFRLYSPNEWRIR
jgi:hypothetical protein